METTKLKPYRLEVAELTPIFYKMRVRRLAIVPFILLIYFFLPPPMNVPTMTVVATMMIVFLGIVGIALWFATKASVGSAKNRFVLEERNIEFDDKFLRSESISGAVGAVPLANIVQARQTPTHFLLYVAKAQIVVVPRTAFSSPRDEERLQLLLRELGVLK